MMAHAIDIAGADRRPTHRPRSARDPAAGRADAARHARVILLLADGCSYATIATMTGCSSRTIALWKLPFVQDGLAGLVARAHAGRAAHDCRARVASIHQQ